MKPGNILIKTFGISGFEGNLVKQGLFSLFGCQRTLGWAQACLT
jgi:hypothetical protein